MILHCSEEANPGCSAAEPSHRPAQLFGHVADKFPAPALIAWIVLFERNAGVKGKPHSGGEAALDARVPFKKAGLPSDQGHTAVGASRMPRVRGPPLIPFPDARAQSVWLDRGRPHMRVGKIACEALRSRAASVT